MNREQIFWLAGYLEGEGCFTLQKPGTIGIRVGSTDKDIIEKVSILFERNRIRGPFQYKINKKPVFYTEVWGNKAIEIMKEILPIMGKRRSAKIIEILEIRKHSKGKCWSAGLGRKTECHPERKHYAFGLCRNCYQKNLRKKEKANFLS